MGTWLTGLIVLALVGLAGYNVLKNIRSGKGSCSCGCEGCQSCPNSQGKG